MYKPNRLRMRERKWHKEKRVGSGRHLRVSTEERGPHQRGPYGLDLLLPFGKHKSKNKNEKGENQFMARLKNIGDKDDL